MVEIVCPKVAETPFNGWEFWCCGRWYKPDDYKKHLFDRMLPYDWVDDFVKNPIKGTDPCPE